MTETPGSTMQETDGAGSTADPFDFGSPSEAPKEPKLEDPPDADDDEEEDEDDDDEGEEIEVKDDLATFANTDPPKTSSKPKTGLAAKMKKKAAVKAKGVKKGPPPKPVERKGAKPPERSSTMARKNGSTEAEKEGKVGLSLTEDAAKALRKLRAKMELATGDKVSNSDAVIRAAELALPEISEA